MNNELTKRFFLMKLALSEMLKLSTIPVLPIMSPKLKTHLRQMGWVNTAASNDTEI